ncbi:hypothetical protein, partial [Escherichia coli]|uniref:hypothetical protein n=1 Tax=Escherichia coli TaxID=562 RepID=UPI003CED9F68
ENLNLLADAAEAAFAEAQFDAAQALLDRQARVQPLSPQSQHLAGLIAMRQLDWARAAALYREMLDGGHDAPPIRYNLAWSLAMTKHFEIALGALDEATSAALPQAAELEVQFRHQLGQLEKSIERAGAVLKL